MVERVYIYGYPGITRLSFFRSSISLCMYLNNYHDMSRSYRKTKAMKISGTSDKDDKIRAHRAFRRATKQVDDLEDAPKKLKEVSDTWGFSSDGRAFYWTDMPDKYLRK